MKIRELITYLEGLYEVEGDLPVAFDYDGYLINLSEESILVREVVKEEFAYKPHGFTGRAVVIQ